jgi:hypothetical protein
MNLGAIVKSTIGRVNPYRQISIYVYAGQVVDENGDVTVSYQPPFTTLANVQPASNQDLKLIQSISLTSIYKTFYILSTNLTGLNRNLSTGGDYIVLDGLKYKIVQVPENFNTGWVNVLGIESNV